jgi:hypothetical protein
MFMNNSAWLLMQTASNVLSDIWQSILKQYNCDAYIPGHATKHMVAEIGFYESKQVNLRKLEC